jgi:hypothetical protein
VDQFRLCQATSMYAIPVFAEMSSANMIAPTTPWSARD